MRSYPLNPWRRIPPNFLFGLFILGGLSVPIFCKPTDRLLGLALGSFFVLLGGGFCWLMESVRLCVSPSGVKMRFFWVTLETPWSNIESLRMDRGQEAFVTVSPLEGSGPDRLASMGGRSYDSTARHWMARARYIPIEKFSWYLRRGLGEDVRRFAPHLQAALDAGPPPPGPAAPKVNMALIIFISLLFTAGIYTLSAFAPHVMGKVVNYFWLILTPLLAIQSGWYAVKAFRNKQIVAGILSSLFSVVLALWTLAIIGMTLEPKKTGLRPSPQSQEQTAPDHH